jgi:hypothetical protein
MRGRLAIVAVLAALAACGDEERVVQPAGCVDGLEQNGEPGELDVLVGDAWFVGLRQAQRMSWREYWDRRNKVARVKAGLVVPAGGTLRLAVPPEARSLIALSHGEDPNAVTLSACHGHYPSAFFPGHFRVRRPLCDVPLDWRYGSERGRLYLSFGRECGAGRPPATSTAAG